MSADALLSRLDRVRQRGPGQWSACCPAHDDKGPSLSVKELPDGLVLVRCFAECSAVEIVGAVGLSLSDLFPPNCEATSGKPLKKPGLLTLRQCVEIIRFECLLAWTAAQNMANGYALTPDDLQRLNVAARRIEALTAEALA